MPGSEKQSKVRFLFLKDIWSSKLSILGAMLTTISAVLIMTAVLLDLTGIGTSTYRGLVAYALLPFIFLLGLVLIPVGIYRVRKKNRKEGKALKPLLIDLSRREHRRRVFFILVMTVLNSIILSFALYEGYHFTDSNQFCGQVCHRVMKPEYMAYQRSSHAHVKCVQCHIGSGASWYVRSKLSGLRQVWAVLTGSFHRPIPTPVENLRPARETCEQCHWPRFFHGRKIVARRKADAASEGSDNLVTVLLLNIGGLNAQTNRYEGIHWHVSSEIKVEYQAVDEKRTQIKAVRVIAPGQPNREFVNKDLPELPAGSPWRLMDCMDCHNRPTHVFDEPEEAVNGLLLDGKIDRRLPQIQTLGLAVLTAAYQPPLGVVDQMEKKMSDFYGQSDPQIVAANRQAIRQAAEALYAVYRENVFPEMNITFQTYPNHINHRREQFGCFRCHDELHESPDGKTISQDCELCHQIILQDEPEKNVSEDIHRLIR